MGEKIYIPCCMALALIALTACQSDTLTTTVQTSKTTLEKADSAIFAVASTDVTNVTSEPLPMRSGERIRTTGSVPHVQTNVQPDRAINEALEKFAFSLPGITERPTRVSLPGAKGMWLDDTVALDRPDTILSGREFAHIHPDGSLHAPLPVERARELQEKGWGEFHPWSGRRPGMDGFVMIYSALDEEELAVVSQLIIDSYNHVTGRSLREPAI